MGRERDDADPTGESGSATGTAGRVGLAVVGAGGLLLLSGPVAWGHSLGLDSRAGAVVVVLLGVPALVAGVLAGLLDGCLTSAPSRFNRWLALVIDTVALAPHWCVAAWVLVLLQGLEETSAPASVVIPLAGWWSGVLVLHLVSSGVRRVLARGAGSPRRWIRGPAA